eukprot:195591-Alexandrium_andersonii.AAC.1
MAYCYRHKKSCPIFPPVSTSEIYDEDMHPILWLDVSGVICTPWSIRGLQRHWLDPAALPTL